MSNAWPLELRRFVLRTVEEFPGIRVPSLRFLVHEEFGTTVEPYVFSSTLKILARDRFIRTDSEFRVYPVRAGES